MILDEIVHNKRREVEDGKRRRPRTEIERQLACVSGARDFLGALRAKARPAVIAECKRASPSRGLIRDPYDPVAIARSYEANGAAAISVLTDEKYFQGSLADLTAVRNAVSLPVLRKDFIIDEYQIFEARAAGADVILLIAAILGAAQMRDLIEVVRTLGMQALVEVHDEREIERAAAANTGVIGVNNRNLDTLEVDLRTTGRLMPLLPPDALVVSESGIKSREDIAYLREVGVGAVLVGERFMSAPDPGRALAELINM
jgi:indole-3-glycerol phosphate synthase